ncbi:dTDP-4-dehydrorhamnose reductase [Dactylosporangium sp. AC04546]|uniref:dTDP-4-dehydrorhamnose reductase n=1 Tax=Dactylosporangium sp. AC04546 TaxID=2862460 RepID=UPI001EDD204D|nr:dTDP-4-dehydrorhamnose reductase [Dactylosporangium sp. AC04546]WVK80329.1 dTDP-4-dehydrorhamnose reductase [Dactylosporangium sp. AC04546]
MSSWLLTGAGGMLGQDVLHTLSGRVSAQGHTVTAVKRADLDITDAAAVRAMVDGHDVVINAAAWTDVDGAESDEAAATAVNGTGVAHLASACAATGARLLHVSTDYVFAGNASEPYAEDAPTAPLNAYGRSKLVGEQAVLATLPAHGYVVRTAWLYGMHGRNFVTTMLRLAGERDFVDVVDDQIGQPTWSGDLAAQLVALGDAALAGTAPAGVYHGTASGRTSWFGLAQAVFAEAGLDPARVRPTTSERFARPAPRPAFSVLGHDRWQAAGVPPMREWRGMLTAALSNRPSGLGKGPA